MKRWPVIRHIRYYYLAFRVHMWAMKWGSLGVGIGWPNQYDLDRLDEIWEGKA